MVIITSECYIVKCRRNPSAKHVLWITKTEERGNHNVVDADGHQIEITKQKRKDTYKSQSM